MRTLILVRHGETIENSTGDLQGCDPTRGRLTARGMQQARVVGRALADVPLARAFCSPLERAVLTMALMLAHRPAQRTVPLRFDADLREMDMGDFAGRTRVDWAAAADAFGDRLRFVAPNGESFERLQARVAAWFDRAVRHGPDETVLIVAHGGVIRGILAHVTGEPMAMAWAGLGSGPPVHNGGLSRIELAPDGSVGSVVANDTAHLAGFVEAPGAGHRWSPIEKRWHQVEPEAAR